ncbi:unnamed protein product [Mytilus coruscus]|uniref:Poly(3-hydroxybutyrate) depolymerase n=1 Tax=Mytilus coruscus TaxID=42192 RepID=A0A6J8E6W9_MYTCO|nr:unnamed protein product [Mytilus coruscus]
MMLRTHLYFLLLLVVIFKECKSSRLGSYNVDVDKVSISGISSGAGFATQMHVIHSAAYMGVGVVAGVPYGCAHGSSIAALACMKLPIFESVSSMEQLTVSEASKGNIDAVTNMTKDKVYVFAGRADTQINPRNGHNIASYYNHFVSNSNVKAVFNIDAQHCMPTDNYGGPCNKLSSNFINNCGYNAAYDLLNWIYGNLTLLTFDQSEFTENSTSAYSMDKTGYVYIPSGCSHNKCKLHIALHGCKMGRYYIDDVYVKHTGYNEIGELNNIIILYPQAVPNSKNADGCWDMYGFTGPNYASVSGENISSNNKKSKAARNVVCKLVDYQEVREFEQVFKNPRNSALNLQNGAPEQMLHLMIQ